MYGSVSQQAPHGQQQAQPTQYRVARIVEDTAGDLVFDLTSNAFHGGSVRALCYNIGDHDDDGCFDFQGDVRAVVEEISDEEGLTTILLDSGADASVFPMSLMKQVSLRAAKVPDFVMPKADQFLLKGQGWWRFDCQPAQADRFC